MHTNPFNPYFRPPRVGPVQRRLSSSDFIRHHPSWSLGLACFVWGGLKGKMAPGDAHPYLALFYLGFLGDSGFCAQNLKNFVVVVSFSGLRGGIGGFRACFWRKLENFCGMCRKYRENACKKLRNVIYYICNLVP